MKKIITALIVVALGLVASPVNAADVNNFYFSDFTGDYYLTKDEDGKSGLRVVESVTAEFPDYNQNKGICRQIPFTNQDGANITLPNLTRSNLKLTRNGELEPIYSIDREGYYYDVCTGTNEYVLGTQVYTFEYEFQNVVTEFNKDGRAYQELYWDTNGNGSQQRFDKVTARVHFENDEVWSGKSWCYVGTYGANDQARCTINKISDGVEFTATNLSAHENLTFDVELAAGAYVVVVPDSDYTYVWIMVFIVFLCLLWLGWTFKKFLATRDKARYYKGLFVAPQFQPSSDYSLPEMAEIYLGKKKDAKVAMLLELVVNHKIEFKKGEKRKWNVLVKNLDGVGEEYIDLLAILNNGTRPAVGDDIELKRRSASNRLITLRKSMESIILGDLKRDGLVENKYTISGSTGNGIANVIATVILALPVAAMIGLVLLSILDGTLEISSKVGTRMVFKDEFYISAIVVVLVSVVIWAFLTNETQKYAKYTMAGLKAVRYMDGLRLYIEMAEADRMKMLQSVEGADTSAEGIVRLYEKLLPYAAVFGLEESWMKEMKEYCKVEEIEEPDYLTNGIMVSELARTMRSAANYATTSTVMSSSGGGSSSGFSGGGGGGFSGGGGGGGGFSGR